MVLIAFDCRIISLKYMSSYSPCAISIFLTKPNKIVETYEHIKRGHILVPWPLFAHIFRRKCKTTITHIQRQRETARITAEQNLYT